MCWLTKEGLPFELLHQGEYVYKLYMSVTVCVQGIYGRLLVYSGSWLVWLV